jgi:hypothetical protein
MLSLLKEVFGMCAHRHISRPVTLDGATYCCCLECGNHLPVQDWQLVKGKRVAA